MHFLVLLFSVVGVLAFCLLAMSVGLIFRKKSFRSCGGAARDFQGKSISCAACSGRDKGTCQKTEDNNT